MTDPDPVELLTALDLPMHKFIASDGLPSMRVRSSDEAALMAVHALREAGLLAIPGQPETTARHPRFTVWQDKAGEWRWTLHAANGRKAATSGEAFASHGNAVRAATRTAGIAAEAAANVITVRPDPEPDA